MSDNSKEARLLRAVDDYISGRFTIKTEEPLIRKIISLTSPKLTSDEVFEVLFGQEEMVETPEEGVAALQACLESKEKGQA